MTNTFKHSTQNPAATPEAVYFGADGKLFGQFHKPETISERPAVVICSPLGFEQIRAFRATKVLAERLADAGFFVLRFDYETTGDSAGNETDPDRLALLLSSIHEAIRFATKSAGVAELALIGLRLGANLAAKVAEETELKQLVLWAPCDSGSIYVREQQIMAAAQSKRTAGAGNDSNNDTGIDAGGYYLTSEIQSDLHLLAFSEQAFCGNPDVLLLNRDDIKITPRLAQRLGKNNPAVEMELSLGYRQMMLPPQLATIPAEAIGSLCHWLNARNSQNSKSANAPPARNPEAPVATSTIESGVLEDALRFGPDNGLFGIITQPEAAAATGKSAVLLLCGGATHRISANRMYVTMARRLAKAGITSMRLDLSGLGDSLPRPGQAENKPYTAVLGEDVNAAMDTVKKVSGIDRFVLFGLCSGAYAAMQTALDSNRVSDLVLANQLVYYLTTENLNGLASGAYRSAHDLDFPRSDALVYKAAVKVLRKIPSSLNWPGQWLARYIVGGPLASDLDMLVARGIRLAFVQSSRDDAVDALAITAGRKVCRLQSANLARIQSFDATDHTFSPSESQQLLAHWLINYLAERNDDAPQANQE